MEFIQIEVTLRDERGSRAMHRLRAAEIVPAVLYGLGRRNLPLAMPEGELGRFLHSGSHLIELKMGDETRDAILREVQIDPLSDRVLHVDFQRVDKNVAVETDVPVVYKGQAEGVKEGGLFQGLLERVKLSARPRDLPREILIDISALQIGDEIKVKDLPVFEDVAYVDGEDQLVAHCVAMKVTALAEDEEGDEGGSSSEPVIVGKPDSGNEG